jgi:ABC-type Fe3+-siderophore transport system permease subunit
MRWSRAQWAFAIGVGFLVLAVIAPASGPYLTTVGVILAFIVAPVFFLLGRVRR